MTNFAGGRIAAAQARRRNRNGGGGGGGPSPLPARDPTALQQSVSAILRRPEPGQLPEVGESLPAYTARRQRERLADREQRRRRAGSGDSNGGFRNQPLDRPTAAAAAAAPARATAERTSLPISPPTTSVDAAAASASVAAVFERRLRHDRSSQQDTTEPSRVRSRADMEGAGAGAGAASDSGPPGVDEYIQSLRRTRLSSCLRHY